MRNRMVMCLLEYSDCVMSRKHTVLFQNRTKQSRNPIKEHGSRGKNSIREPYFLLVSSIVSDRRLKWTERRGHKNTYRSSLENTKKKRMCVGLATRQHSSTHPLWSDANRLSKHISIHTSLREIAFKLTFRWK